MPYLSENIFLTEDNMMWMILQSDLETLMSFFHENEFALYAVDFDDNNEFLIEYEDELKEVYTEGQYTICIEIIKFKELNYKL